MNETGGDIPKSGIKGRLARIFHPGKASQETRKPQLSEDQIRNLSIIYRICQEEQIDPNLQSLLIATKFYDHVAGLSWEEKLDPVDRIYEALNGQGSSKEFPEIEKIFSELHREYRARSDSWFLNEDPNKADLEIISPLNMIGKSIASFLEQRGTKVMADATLSPQQKNTLGVDARFTAFKRVHGNDKPSSK